MSGRLRQLADEVRALVSGQVAALRRIADEECVKIGHVKLHGALYNQAARDTALAGAVHEAVRAAGVPALLVPAGSVQERVSRGLAEVRVVAEVFADRAYRADGSLAPRTSPGALITDEESAVAQVLRLVREGKVRALSGEDVVLRGETVCLHGDGPRAVVFARRLREALREAGVEVEAFAR